MFLHILLSPFLLPPSLCSLSARRLARDHDLDQAPQRRALPILDDLPSLDMFNISASDAATMQVQTSVGHNYVIRCNNAHFGGGLEARSCFSALDQSPTGTVQESWGFDTPAFHPDVALPLKVFSDDATCFIQPTVLGSAANRRAQASAKDVTEAARAVIQECVIRRRIGGAAFRIGGDNHLGVAVARFIPQVTCAGTVSTSQRSCRYIMDEMLKTGNFEYFGRPTASARIQVALPLTLRAPDGRCQVVISTPGNTALRTTWFKVWDAIEATVALCVRAGKGGISKVPINPPPPDKSVLNVQVMDEPASSVGAATKLVGLQVPSSFAQLQYPEGLPVSLVKGSPELMLPSQTDSALIA